MNFSANYQTSGILVLLNEDCILKSFCPLIPLKESIVQGLLMLGAQTKEMCLALSDEDLVRAGVPVSLTGLFRRFLRLYDYKGKGAKDIPDAENKTPEEIASLIELMHLPGVKAVRADLYLKCGLTSLKDFASWEADKLLKHIEIVKKANALPHLLPFPKEIRTQIAVAKVFTEYSVL